MVRERQIVSRDRWLVSYADFITLLFAFFVVMYSMSSVNDGKYLLVSKSLESAFASAIPAVSEQSESTDATIREPSSYSGGVQDGHTIDALPAVEILIQQIRTNLNQAIEQEWLSLQHSQHWLEVMLSDALLFPSAGAALSAQAEIVLTRLTKILAPYYHAITIEGYTDNQPIENQRYTSNWELSADRAAAVAHFFVEAGIAPSRLAIMGFGENFPIAENTTAAGRAKNRRVVLMVEPVNTRRDFLAAHSVITPVEARSKPTPLDDEISLEIQQELVIQPKMPIGNSIRGRTLPDGTIRYDSRSIYQKDDK